MQIELVKSDFLGETNHYTFQLTFDNRAFSLASLAMTREEKHLPISASVLFEIFPFCIVFGWVAYDDNSVFSNFDIARKFEHKDLKACWNILQYRVARLECRSSPNYIKFEQHWLLPNDFIAIIILSSVQIRHGSAEHRQLINGCFARSAQQEDNRMVRIEAATDCLQIPIGERIVAC